MEYTVEQTGGSWGNARAFVCNQDGFVVVEAFGATQEDADARAEIVADAFNEDAHVCDPECGETQYCPRQPRAACNCRW